MRCEQGLISCNQSIFFIVCPNGVGHFKRVMEVVDNILKSSTVEVYVACQSWQKSRINIISQERLHFVEDLMEPGISYKFFDQNLFSDKKYMSWEYSIASMQEFQNANLVISDNLCGALDYHDNVMLMGSFLWMDLLARDKRYQSKAADFIDREKMLLNKYRPQMLCVEDIVMPAVRDYTQAVTLPWFDEISSTKTKNLENKEDHFYVAVLLGRTGVMDTWLDEFMAVAKSRGIQLKLPAPYHEKYGVDIFNFSNEEFQSMDLVLCRPGIGVLTDCIKNRTAFLSVFEANNAEMEHNGKVMSAILKTAELGADPDAENVFDCVQSLGANRLKINEIKACLENRKLGGSTEAARHILANLQNN